MTLPVPALMPGPANRLLRFPDQRHLPYPIAPQRHPAWPQVPAERSNPVAPDKSPARLNAGPGGVGGLAPFHKVERIFLLADPSSSIPHHEIDAPWSPSDLSTPMYAPNWKDVPVFHH